MGVFVRIGIGVSLSLSGTSNIFPLGKASLDGVLDGDLCESVLSSLGVVGRGAICAADFMISFGVSLRSGVSDLRAIDAKLKSGIRLRAAFPYVAIFLRGGALS